MKEKADFNEEFKDLDKGQLLSVISTLNDEIAELNNLIEKATYGNMFATDDEIAEYCSRLIRKINFITAKRFAANSKIATINWKDKSSSIKEHQSAIRLSMLRKASFQVLGEDQHKKVMAKYNEMLLASNLSIKK